MRRPNRNIEIFSLSVLDLFSAVMGAFIIISIVLFPYYLKSNQNSNAPDTKAALTQCKEDLNKAQSQSSAAANALGQCHATLGNPFLVILMQWDQPGFDVDLHVVDPAGHAYYWQSPHRRYDGSPAALTEDNVFGPGAEVWQNPDAVAGTYCIAYNLYNFSAAAKPDGAIAVKGIVYYRNGEVPLKEVVLSKAESYAQVASLVIAENGMLTVHPGWECPSEPAEDIQKSPQGDLEPRGASSPGRLH